MNVTLSLPSSQPNFWARNQLATNQAYGQRTKLAAALESRVRVLLLLLHASGHSP
jgi:hypothetical protein